jgi:O-antigen ligase
VNVPSRAGGSPPAATLPSERVAVAATTVFLFAAPFSASAGLRTTCLIAAALGLAFTARRGGLPHWRELPAGLIAAWIAWCVLAAASLAWSVDAGYTRSELRAHAGYSTLALCVFFLAARSRNAWPLWVGSLGAGALAAFATQQSQDLLPFALSRHPMDGGGGPWSTHLVLLAPTLVAWAWPRPWGLARPRAWLAGAVALLAIAAWDSGNRMVWAAFGAELALVMVLWRHMPARQVEHGLLARRVMAVAALAMGVAFCAAVVERNTRHFGEQPVTTHLEHDLRPGIWQTARERIGEAPWLGHGFGREILAGDFRKHTAGAGPEIRHGHNIFLDMWLQLGAVGLAAFAAILVLLAREYVRMLRDPELAPWAVIGLAILAGFMAKNQTDDFLHRHNALVFWALNGALLGLGRRSGPP